MGEIQEMIERKNRNNTIFFKSDSFFVFFGPF